MSVALVDLGYGNIGSIEIALKRLGAEVMVAELIGVVPSPNTYQVEIDKGADDGVFVGQAVIDAEGWKYFSPSAGPATFHFRGSCECKPTIATTDAPTTPAYARPTRHLIGGPARRCNQ